jgi:hypothetical protein
MGRLTAHSPNVLALPSTLLQLRSHWVLKISGVGKFNPASIPETIQPGRYLNGSIN